MVSIFTDINIKTNMEQLTKEQTLQNLIIAANQGKYTLEEAEAIKQSITIVQNSLKELDNLKPKEE